MIDLLAVLLALNAILHAGIVGRHGVRGNLAFAAYIVVYAALAVVVFLQVPHAVRATFLLALAGLIGLTMMFRALKRDKTLDRLIWVLDLATVALAGWLLWAN